MWHNSFDRQYKAKLYEEPMQAAVRKYSGIEASEHFDELQSLSNGIKKRPLYRRSGSLYTAQDYKPWDVHHSL